MKLHWYRVEFRTFDGGSKTMAMRSNCPVKPSKDPHRPGAYLRVLAGPCAHRQDLFRNPEEDVE